MSATTRIFDPTATAGDLQPFETLLARLRDPWDEAALATPFIRPAFAQGQAIKIGAILPLTGPGGLIGTQQQRERQHDYQHDGKTQQQHGERLGGTDAELGADEAAAPQNDEESGRAGVEQCAGSARVRHAAAGGA